jgi:transcriptional regulator with XRE-family HTH domain
MEKIVENPVLEKIKSLVEKTGSQMEVAKQLGIGSSYLSEILKGTRPISETVARKLGYFRVITFLRVDGTLTGKGDEIGAVIKNRNAHKA